jgi:ribosome-binding protein aMBF1 (putative translation factor)
MATTPTSTKGATPRSGQVFEQFLDEQLADSEFRAGFERELAKVKSVASILIAIETARAEKGIPKAEVARRMDRQPSAVRRLLSGKGANPTLDTVVDLADAVGLELDIRIQDQPKRQKPGYSPLHVSATVALLP